MIKTLYIWYIQFCLNIVAFYLLYQYGILEWVIANDERKLKSSRTTTIDDSQYYIIDPRDLMQKD